MFFENLPPSFVQDLTPQNVQTLCVLSLRSLGQLFIKMPVLMLREDARAFMDSTFASGDVRRTYELVKIFVDFLKDEQRRMITVNRGKTALLMFLEKELTSGKEDKNIDIGELVGDANEMGDASVSSSVMQIYLDRIIACLLDNLDPSLSFVAFEVVQIIVEQGLVHPVKVFSNIFNHQVHACYCSHGNKPGPYVS
jgi:hypothetical protein